MFFRVFALFALVAVAFASPKPDPQVITYGAVPVGYSGYSPVAYAASPYVASPYAAAPAAVPYAYTGYGGYYVR